MYIYLLRARLSGARGKSEICCLFFEGLDVYVRVHTLLYISVYIHTSILFLPVSSPAASIDVIVDEQPGGGHSSLLVRVHYAPYVCTHTHI